MRPSTALQPPVLTPRQLSARVERLIATPAEWVARVRLDVEGRWYERIHLGGAFEVWLISWMPGQATGFHDHGGSNGAFGVAWGDLDECEVPRNESDGEVRVNRIASGRVRSFGPRHVHDVRNSAVAAVAVSVHAYSPPLSEMTRYDLTPSGLRASGSEGSADW